MWRRGRGARRRVEGVEGVARDARGLGRWIVAQYAAFSAGEALEVAHAARLVLMNSYCKRVARSEFLTCCLLFCKRFRQA